MSEDAALLRRYAEDKSEAAFAELVRRHLDLVYAVALRQVGGDAHLAQDVAQTVFTALARKAAALAARPVLGGWLYRTTQFAAIDVVRAERRRRAREAEAQTMHELTSNPGGETDWEKIRPTLDQVIGELGDRDRDAVVLRFLEGKSFAAVGERLRLTENAARMRVERALDKLHALLARRGVTSTAAALGLALAQQAAGAAPAGLAANVTGAALASAAVGGTKAAAAVFMSMTKLQIGILGALVAAGSAGFVMQRREELALQDELAGVRRQNELAAMGRTKNAQLVRAASEGAAASADAATLARLRGQAAALRERMNPPAVAPAATRKAEPTFTGLVFESGQVDQQPKSSSQIPPLFPAEFRARPPGVVGQALIDFVIDDHGAVRNAQLVSATHPAIGEAALEAVNHWRFEPAQKDGHPVAMHRQEPVIFTLNDDPKSAMKSTASQSESKPGPAHVPWF